MAAGNARNDLQSFVISLVNEIRPVADQLLTLLSSDLKLLKKCPIEYANLVEKEMAIVNQSLFFLFSSNQVGSI